MLALKPWTTAQFEQQRSHMTGFVRESIIPVLEDGLSKILAINAPVKSGKRDIVEYIAVRDEGRSSPRLHAFISAWHRAADNDQRKELSLHNMKVFSINNKPAADACIRWIAEATEQGKQVVLHVDECDHGSGEKQILAKVYRKIRNNSHVFSILYSATPEEVLFSDDMNDEDEGDEMLDDLLHGTSVKYIPPPEFCGPGRFLRENLVIEASPFFTMTPVPALTEQGREFIQGLKRSMLLNTGRNIGTLRLTKKDGPKKENKDIRKFMRIISQIPELADVIIWVDKGECDIGNTRKIEWSSRDFWRATAKDVPILIVHDQTSSRSTEWDCHDRIFATHDYRTSLSYAIISQAQERVNHYTSKYESGFQPIKIYGHKKTFQLSAGLISYAQYLENDWKMRKVNVHRAERDNNIVDVYDIKSKEGVLHPDYQTPLTKNEAENILRELGSFGDLSISSRVNGKIRRLPVFATHWFECTSENFTVRMTTQLTNISYDGNIVFANPFLHHRRPTSSDGGLEKGYLRKWDVFDYDTDVKTQPGCGVCIGTARLTICYSQGVLGVAIRWHTGTFTEMNRLNAYRSMYPGRTHQI